MKYQIEDIVDYLGTLNIKDKSMVRNYIPEEATVIIEKLTGENGYVLMLQAKRLGVQRNFNQEIVPRLIEKIDENDLFSYSLIAPTGSTHTTVMVIAISKNIDKDSLQDTFKSSEEKFKEAVVNSQGIKNAQNFFQSFMN